MATEGRRSRLVGAISALLVLVLAGVATFALINGDAKSEVSRYLVAAEGDEIAAEAVELYSQHAGAEELARRAAKAVGKPKLTVVARDVKTEWAGGVGMVELGMTYQLSQLSRGVLIISPKYQGQTSARIVGYALGAAVQQPTQDELLKRARAGIVGMEEFVWRRMDLDWQGARLTDELVPTLWNGEDKWGRFQSSLVYELGKASGENSPAEANRRLFDENAGLYQLLQRDADSGRWRAMPRVRSVELIAKDPDHRAEEGTSVESAEVRPWSFAARDAWYEAGSEQSEGELLEIAAAIHRAEVSGGSPPGVAGFPYMIEYVVREAESEPKVHRVLVGNDHRWVIRLHNSEPGALSGVAVQLEPELYQQLRRVLKVSPEWPMLGE